MTLFLEALIAGIVTGSVYSLIGTGYIVIFKATGVFNLAQGDLVMVGIMSSFLLLTDHKWAYALAAPAIILFVIAISVVEEQTVVRPFLSRRGAANFGWFIATLGFSLAIETVVNILFGTHPIVSIPSLVPTKGVRFHGIVVGYQQILIVGTLLVIVGLLDVFYARSWVGQAMRASAEDRDAAAMAGVRPALMSSIAFTIAGATAAIAGIVLAPITFSDPTVGLSLTLKGFLALAVGGFGSLRGAVVGGLLLGASEQIFNLYIGSKFQVLGILGLVLLALLIRPQGIFGVRAARVV
jgi:branched-chain amino acid transport system permease protein